MDSYQPSLLATLRGASRNEREVLMASLDLTIAGWIHIWCEASQMSDVRALAANKALVTAKTLEQQVHLAEFLRERAQRKVIRIIEKKFALTRPADTDPRDIDLLISSMCRRLRLLGRRRLTSHQRFSAALSH